MKDRLNMRDDGVEPVLWDMVEQIVSQLDNAEAVAWSREGVLHLQRNYPDGTQAIIEWQFGKAEFQAYLAEDSIRRALFVTAGGQLLNTNTDTLEKLESLPQKVKLLGFLKRGDNAR